MAAPEYALCQNGTQQGPIALSSSQGFSSAHLPSFHNYDNLVAGEFSNWAFGPTFNLYYNKTNMTSLPSMTFDNETVYLLGWHTHAPAEHVIDGVRSRSELHLVHGTADGKYRAVVAIRLDPGSSVSPFFASLPPLVGFNSTSVIADAKLNMNLALSEVDYLDHFWTYQGSLTTPPCSEGLRFFVAKDVLTVSADQMQALLGVSTYSTRQLQPIWSQQVNA